MTWFPLDLYRVRTLLRVLFIPETDEVREVEIRPHMALSKMGRT